MGLLTLSIVLPCAFEYAFMERTCQSIYEATPADRCVEIKIYVAFVLNHRVDLHAIDATPARWRSDAGSSPLDGASAAASSPRMT